MFFGEKFKCQSIRPLANPILDFLQETHPKFCTKKNLLRTTITTDSMTSVMYTKYFKGQMWDPKVA